MSLSVCFLTRDAESSLGHALRSVADLGAEVLVADTGSTDGTIAVAQAHGARALTIAWADDFSAAQNQALAAATGEWVLWLNPDEVLLPYPAEQRAALLARQDALAFLVRVQIVAQADQAGPYTETWQLRLFRRHPELRYVGRLHPRFAVPIEEVARRANQQVGLSDVIVQQHAYRSVLTEPKLRWATRLLELELRDRPGQLDYLIEYGRNLLRLHDPRGHEVLADASEQVLAVAEQPAAPSATVASLLEYLLSVAPEQSRSRVDRGLARTLALRWFATSPPLLWQLAHNAYAAQDYRNAAALLERSIHLGRTGGYDHASGFDPSVMGDAAVLNLARCHGQLGERDRAESLCRQLFNSPTVAAEARQLFERLQARR